MKKWMHGSGSARKGYCPKGGGVPGEPTPWERCPAVALLFVYGTLRRGFNHPMARLLALHARYVGAGWLNGRLYHLGRYPGVIFSHRPDDWVRGDLYEMNAPPRLLSRLDRYEGVDTDRKRLAEYQRLIAEIRRGDGATQQAWVYCYRLPVNRLKRLGFGD